MTECYAEIGPLCWTVPWKFWVWAFVMTFGSGPLIAYSLYRMWRRK